MSLSKHFASKRHQEAAQQAAKPALEDLDTALPGPAPIVLIQPNPGPVQSAAQAYRDLEMLDHDSFVSGTEQALEGLVEVRSAIESANQSGGLSIESAYLANVAVEAYYGRLGMDTAPLAQAFEAASDNPDGKTAIATESLDLAIEDVDSFWRTTGKRAASGVKRAITPLWSTVKVKSISLSMIVRRAQKVKPRPGATISVSSHSLLQGEVPTTKNLPAAFLADATNLAYMVHRFSEDAARDFEANVDSLALLGEKGKTPRVEVIEERMPRLLAAWKDPRSHLQNGGGHVYLGNYRLFHDEALKYTGKNPTARKFDELANNAYPSLLAGNEQKEYSRAERGRDEQVEIPALTPEEIVKIGSQLQLAARNAGAGRAFIESLSGPAYGVAAISPVVASGFLTWTWFLGVLAMASMEGRRKRANYAVSHTPAAKSGRRPPEVATVVDALNTSNRMKFHVSYDALRVLSHHITLFNTIAKLSLKAHAGIATATESFDQQHVTDGVSVNETAPNEPTQDPIPNDLAPEGEVVKPIESINDAPETVQGLNGTAADEATAEAEGHVHVVEVSADGAEDARAPVLEHLEDKTSTAAPVKVVTEGPARPYYLK